ncbi:MAG: hypothetical protein RIR18_1396 [Pseudomonadota bacterium]|jgi:hypothetical protein
MPLLLKIKRGGVLRRLWTLWLLSVCFPIGVLAETAIPVGQVRMLIQESPLAGSQYHDLGQKWELITVGADLTLRREPGNPHDVRAIRVEWQGNLLGYVPRRENRAVAVAMDEGDELVAKVTALRPHRNPWLRVRFAVYSVL